MKFEDIFKENEGFYNLGDYKNFLNNIGKPRNITIGKVDNKKDCNHKKKIDEKYLFLSSPPKIKWQCKKCGCVGFKVLEYKT